MLLKQWKTEWNFYRYALTVIALTSSSRHPWRWVSSCTETCNSQGQFAVPCVSIHQARPLCDKGIAHSHCCYYQQTGTWRINSPFLPKECCQPCLLLSTTTTCSHSGLTLFPVPWEMENFEQVQKAPKRLAHDSYQILCQNTARRGGRKRKMKGPDTTPLKMPDLRKSLTGCGVYYISVLIPCWQ